MAHGALIEHRPWLTLSVIAATAYYFVSDNPIGGVWLIALKGAGVGLLAIYALRRTRGVDGAILTMFLALSAAADMVLELNVMRGGAVFFAAHVFATLLFLRNRRPSPTRQNIVTAAGLLLATPFVSYLLSDDPFVALYAIALGAMAACAWISRFAVKRVGLGAVLFIMSDWLIFSRMGSLDLGELPGLLIWPLYYAAQVMIATGVVQTLRGELRSNDAPGG